MKTYKVIQWATGRCGKIAIPAIVARDDLELVGVWVSSEKKDGRDAGEICGIDPIGVRATRDADALLAGDADCVVYAPTSYSRVEESIADVERILRAGKNVVSNANAQLVYPAFFPEIEERLRAACLAGEVSLFTWGIDPGIGAIGSAITALSACSEVHRIRMTEIVNYGFWDHPYNMSLFGFGQPDVEKVALFVPGMTTAIWGSSVQMVADAMGVVLDEVTETHEVLYADEDFDVPAGHVAKGTISAMCFAIQGMVDGQPRVVVDHVTRLRDEDAPDWDQGHGYQVQIEGEPNVQVNFTLSSGRGDIVHAAYVATAMPIVNAIPAVCDAPPGILTYRDVRPHPARNFVVK
jgi:4-hydroxy-tetrahydrodipicolinate reductase